jgi:hypothetical protein
MDFSLSNLFGQDKAEFPTTPRQVKKWLANLPLVNMGETTKEFYEQLRKLNRAELPARSRLDDMELMRPTSKIVLEHLNKHLTSRTLPLPPKSQKIGRLSQALTLEMATAYKLVLRDVIQGEEKIDAKRLALTVHRALRYLGEVQVLSARLYTSAPTGIWNDINQLYTFAEKNKIHQRMVVDNQLEISEKSSIESVYKQICLFAISRPEALHQGEAQKLNTYFEHAATTLNITNAPVLDNMQSVYVVNLLTGEPPQSLPLEKLSSSAANRYLDLQTLQQEVRKLISDQDTGAWDIVTEKTSVSFDLARRLIESWSANAKRRFGRAVREDVITSAIGLPQIYEAIEADVETTSGKALPEDSPVELSLQTIPDDQQVVDYWDEPIDHNDTLAGQPANVWDLVTSGNIINDEYLKTKKEELKEQMEMQRPAVWQDWKVINTSAGGYCLLWEETDSSKAQVGELIGLREQEGSDYEWRIGTIRWMVYVEKRGLEIGVQLLAPKTLLVRIDAVNNRRVSFPFPVNSLMLPGIKTIQQQPTLILPSKQFQVGDDVSFTLFGKEMRVILTKKTLSTATFTQYRYQGYKQARQNQQQTDEDTGSFDTLWSSL